MNPLQSSVICSLVMLAASGAADDIQPICEPENLERWFEHVDASDDELSWKTGIEWSQSFARAIEEAREHDRPILLYGATGDPQGCT